MNDAADRLAKVEAVDAVPVDRSGQRSLYASRPRIHPKLAQGTYRRLKWAVMAVTLGIYYLTPWLRWDRGPNAPDQAVLIDFPARRFYFFFIEIWPQEIYYLTGLLILAAVGLFLMTSLAGRVWCGYTCPQTVWTDLFIAIERWVEGDRNARLKLDRAPWSVGKLARKAVKHALWLVVGVATGGAWVFYFADAPTLAGQLATLQAPSVAYVFIGILTLTTYALGGLAREQVCIYMCPWPRIQGSMLDEESLVVTYHPERGEPRGSHRAGQSWEGRGHCVDCNQCVAVCPMGIDIRNGQQFECITCALCIDACDGVMDKLGLPKGLISYDTLANMQRQSAGEKPRLRLVRPRTVFYAAILAIVGVAMLATLLTRSSLDVNIQRDRNPLYVILADGSVRNGYTVKILNKAHDARRFALSVEDLPGTVVSVVGQDSEDGLDVPADSLRSFRVFLAVPQQQLRAGSTDLSFVVRDRMDGREARQANVFITPGP
ncbi:MAG: cytochrome c oxidase accessory protein CcoG [Alphaproteobacteria bacterium]